MHGRGDGKYDLRPPLLRRLAVRLPVYKLLLDVRARRQAAAVACHRGGGRATRAYCISPYRSGTTYVAGLFAGVNRVAHEPLHYATLLRMDDAAFLERRAAYLALDLESTGCFSNRLAALRRFAPDAPVLYLSRPPELWIGSVVNYFVALDRRVRFNYTARLFFDPVCGGPIERFFALPEAGRAGIVRGLLEFWIGVYGAAAADPRARVIPLEALDGRVAEVADFFGLRPNGRPAWQRANPAKRPLRVRDYLDPTPYRPRVAALGYDI